MQHAGPMPVLETPRLVLRPYEASDLDDVAAMYGDREVTAQTFLGYRDRRQVQDLLDEYLAFLGDRGFGMVTIRDRATNRYLGETGLVGTSLGSPGLRYTLARAGWGQGFATEATIPVIADAFGRAGLGRIIAGVKAENKASLRVMEKLGFTWESEVADHGPAFGLFGVTPEAWARRST